MMIKTATVLIPLPESMDVSFSASVRWVKLLVWERDKDVTTEPNVSFTVACVRTPVQEKLRTSVKDYYENDAVESVIFMYHLT